MYSGIYVYLYTYAYIHGTTINEHRGHEFEREQAWLYGRVWREDEEVGNAV